MLNVMIVDDEAVILNGLRHMITAEKTLFTHIECACDGFEALELMEHFHPDLLITDIQMPEMDGLELIRQAKQRNVRHTVILSGYDLFEYAREAIRLKVAEYLLKPIDREELARLLRQKAAEIMQEKSAPAASAKRMLPQEDEGGRQGDSTIGRFKEFIRSHYRQDISLEEVAGHLSLHPNYVCNLLKKEAGLTFVHFLHHTRIEKAKEIMISHPQLPLEKVASAVGYMNPRHFFKVFKQHTGQTPGSYREFK